MQLCVSSHTLDMQVEKEYHILSMVSPYIGPQDRFKVPDPPSSAQGRQTHFQDKAAENKQ